MDELTPEQIYSYIAAMALMGCHPVVLPPRVEVCKNDEEVNATLDALAKCPEPGKGRSAK